jgi:hypothetical protein
MALQLKCMMLHVSLWQASIEKSNRKKKHVHADQKPTNKGQGNQETAVPSARPGDENSGDR